MWVFTKTFAAYTIYNPPQNILGPQLNFVSFIIQIILKSIPPFPSQFEPQMYPRHNNDA